MRASVQSGGWRSGAPWLWRLLGLGGMLTLFGLGVGAAMLGYSFVSDARPEAERMAEVLGRAIEKSTLKVGANGEVTIAEGAEVSLKPEPRWESIHTPCCVLTPIPPFEQ